MIYIKSIVVVSLNNNKFLAISTCINLKKKIKHKYNKTLSTAITPTQEEKKTCAGFKKKKKKQTNKQNKSYL